MKHLVVFLEERSAKAMLEGLLPRILPENVTFRCISFEGKQDLDKQIERRLKGWVLPATGFIILRDQDSANCLTLKNSLKQKVQNAGKPDTVIRIACRELESWYFGDLQSVEEALGKSKLTRYSLKQQYRDPDDIVNPSAELDKITSGAYQKTSGSRDIGKILDPERNTSRSFTVFLEGIKKALSKIPS